MYIHWLSILKHCALQTGSWYLSSLEGILNLEFFLLKLLIFYQKLLWNLRSRLTSSTFWVFRPVFRYVWSKWKLFAQKMKILIIPINRIKNSKCGRVKRLYLVKTTRWQHRFFDLASLFHFIGRTTEGKFL